MSQSLPPVRVRAVPLASRRSFLRYSGASAVVGSLWLANCKGNEPTPVPLTPSIVSFSPATGMPGTTVTITGNNLGGTTAVLLGATAVPFAQAGAAVTFTVPAGAASGPISVTTAAGTATSSTPFTVTAAPSTAPTITSIAPASALPGAQVTITGTNLAGATAVTVNGASAILGATTATSLTFTVPTTTQQGAATVVVTGPGGMATNNTSLSILSAFVNVGNGDAGVLNYAYALEQLEAAFYTQVRAGAYYPVASSAERLALDDLYYHEVIHRDFLKAALTAASATPIKDLTPDFSSIDFSSRSAVLGAAKAFEDLGSAAYIGAAQYITNPGYLLLAGKIASVEARHAALIRDLVSENTFVASDITSSNSLEIAKRPSEVAPVVNAYLAIGSKLDVSGLG